MKFTIETVAPYKMILKVLNSNGKTIYQCDDIQRILNFQVRKVSSLKKKKGKYAGELNKDDIRYLGIIA